MVGYLVRNVPYGNNKPNMYVTVHQKLSGDDYEEFAVDMEKKLMEESNGWLVIRMKKDLCSDIENFIGGLNLDFVRLFDYEEMDGNQDYILFPRDQVKNTRSIKCVKGVWSSESVYTMVGIKENSMERASAVLVKQNTGSTFDFVTGGKEKGESVEMCAIREVSEELNLEFEVVDRVSALEIICTLDPKPIRDFILSEKSTVSVTHHICYLELSSKCGLTMGETPIVNDEIAAVLVTKFPQLPRRSTQNMEKIKSEASRDVRGTLDQWFPSGNQRSYPGQYQPRGSRGATYRRIGDR